MGSDIADRLRALALPGGVHYEPVEARMVVREAAKEIERLRAEPPAGGEPTRVRRVRDLLGIPPVGEQDLHMDISAAVGALRDTGRTGTRRGEPSDEQRAASLGALWRRISAVLDEPVGTPPAPSADPIALAEQVCAEGWVGDSETPLDGYGMECIREFARVLAGAPSAPEPEPAIRTEWVDGGLIVGCDHGTPSAVIVNGEHFAAAPEPSEVERAEREVQRLREALMDIQEGPEAEAHATADRALAIMPALRSLEPSRRWTDKDMEANAALAVAAVTQHHSETVAGLVQTSKRVSEMYTAGADLNGVPFESAINRMTEARIRLKLAAPSTGDEPVGGSER